MRLPIITGVAATALICAAAAAVAVADGFNTYSATLGFSPAKPGSPRTPSGLSFTENFAATGTGGNRTAPLTDVKTKIYGVVASPNGFPICSETRIANAHSDLGCPRGAMIASGDITAVIGPTADVSTDAPGTFNCNPLLHLWNGGHGTDVFFFVVRAPDHVCGPIQTGDIGPYTGTLKTRGRSLVFDTPVPPYVSFPITGLEGSIESLHLRTLNANRSINGRNVALLASVGCQAGKRPYSVSFTAEQPGAPSQTVVVSHEAKC
ncbi:MAG: hypothetical protein ACTHQQ_03860 [Solirubrobacteraceae bacterium]